MKSAMKSAMLLLVLLVAIPASAQDYLPLEEGYFWSYTISNSAFDELRVVGEPINLLGEMVYPIGHPGFDPFQNLVNYWSIGPDGDLLLHGWSRGTFGYFYQPPVVLLDSPLEVGKTWSSTVDFYTCTDTTYVETHDLSYMVHDRADITVPAGTFDCFGVGDLEDPTRGLLGGRYSISGEEIGSKTGPVASWWAQNVGVVEEYLSDVYQLQDYTDHEVPAESSTWGGVKALFR